MELNDPYVEDKPLGDTQPHPAHAIELIVHGVGGSPPEDMLADDHPVRVSGDRLAGFYRPRQPSDRGDPALPGDQFPQEAFSWGGLTSGKASRALWFLLLPFALMNTAGWMHPPVDGWRRGLCKGWLRLLAAVGTALGVLAATQLSLDLVGYQCGWRLPECGQGHWWLSWLDGSFFASHPGRVVAVAALVPAAALVLWRFAGRHSFRNFEEFVDPEHSGGPALSSEPHLGLDDPSLWQGANPVGRLRRFHFQLGLTFIGVVLALSLAELTTEAWDIWAHLLVWAGVMVLLTLVVGIVHPQATVTAKVRLDDTGLVWGGAIASGLVFAGALVYGFFRSPEIDRADATPRLDGIISPGTVLTGLLIIGTVLLAVVFRRRRSGSFLGIAPAVAVLLGGLMIQSAWAGTGLRLADWFGKPQSDASRLWTGDPGTCDPAMVCYPVWFDNAAVVFTGMLVVGAVGLGVVLLRPAAGTDRRAVLDAFAVRTDAAGNPRPADDRRARSIAWRYRHRRLVTRIDAWLATVVIAGLVAFVGIGTVTTDGHLPGPLVTFSGWVVALVPVAAVFLVRLGLNNPTARRGIGSVFDVLTFFPRRVHPFAPPCYAERAVPQLQWRLGWLTERGGGVVLAAHSQGTVVSAAALLQRPLPSQGAPGDEPTDAAAVPHHDRVRFLTYGSPLVVLYEEHFPAYFGDIVGRVGTALRGTDDDTTRWVHLYCPTDPLGDELAPGGAAWLEQVEIRDPASWLGPAGDPPPTVGGHSAYHRHETRDAWARRLLKDLAGIQRAATGSDERV